MPAIKVVAHTCEQIRSSDVLEEKALKGVVIKPFNSSNTFTLPYRWDRLTREQDENDVQNLDCNQRADEVIE